MFILTVEVFHSGYKVLFFFWSQHPHLQFLVPLRFALAFPVLLMPFPPQSTYKSQPDSSL